MLKYTWPSFRPLERKKERQKSRHPFFLCQIIAYLLASAAKLQLKFHISKLLYVGELH